MPDNAKPKTRCQSYEKDVTVWLEGDEECCRTCAWNNDVTDSCLIGRGEND